MYSKNCGNLFDKILHIENVRYSSKFITYQKSSCCFSFNLFSFFSIKKKTTKKPQKSTDTIDTLITYPPENLPTIPTLTHSQIVTNGCLVKDSPESKRDVSGVPNSSFFLVLAARTVTGPQPPGHEPEPVQYQYAECTGTLYQYPNPVLRLVLGAILVCV